ncbi:hypothetical protein BDD43_5515 [Mucilaginibacter gracilis]|uniref:Uncharacterized protein n=1 Tax=Mucilaginibacter gracilis TaxID=423350 RepID=A0A495J996_9SPHI|nr:hypothetical protein BDD43_5515 [Mucilaginibacter gracilis]
MYVWVINILINETTFTYNIAIMPFTLQLRR